jgi:hypothetical protein
MNIFRLACEHKVLEHGGGGGATNLLQPVVGMGPGKELVWQPHRASCFANASHRPSGCIPNRYFDILRVTATPPLQRAPTPRWEASLHPQFKAKCHTLMCGTSPFVLGEDKGQPACGGRGTLYNVVKLLPSAIIDSGQSQRFQNHVVHVPLTVVAMQATSCDQVSKQCRSGRHCGKSTPPAHEFTYSI